MDLVTAFTQKFQTAPQLIVQSPGRINLIGEHTDYNMGYVLPAAIDKHITLAIAPREDALIQLYTQDLNKTHIVSLAYIEQTKAMWPRYILGVVEELKKEGFALGGFNLSFTGNIPMGGGLSSSAALECATVFALNELFRLGLSKIKMVQIAQQAENNFAGVKCGIMDQFASMMGKANQVIQLDCQSLQYKYFPLNLRSYSVVLLDTKVKHSLASSEYNTRRKECEEGVALMQKKYARVGSLRDATTAMVDEMLMSNPVLQNRCKYVVQENIRLISACNDLDKGDIQSFGKRMFETHEGLSKMYEVSCAELDYIVDLCKAEPSVCGARMMGGGFGGCVIALIETNQKTTIVEKIGNQYAQQFDTQMGVYYVEVGNGTSIM